MKIPFTARLHHEPGLTDYDVMRQRLAHVVDRQCCNACTGQRFHLDTRLVRDLAFAIDHGAIALNRNLDIAVFEPEWVTKWNELVRFLCSHYAGDDRGREHRALLARNFIAFKRGENCVGQYNDTLSMCFAFARRLFADIDHVRPILIVDVA